MLINNGDVKFNSWFKEKWSLNFTDEKFNGESALRSKSFGTYTPYAQNYQQPKERQIVHKRERERLSFVVVSLLCHGRQAKHFWVDELFVK
jgi:hypothetical protein